ncbi:MAG: glycyl-radical enzyme activating protein [Candidatus Delongbacteria bacterium]|jgi:pyruvate formate lyase activating enzyme|nr:glycyl-radical enzyme activating protein [Candidatus Delongbacteria bacterium]
MHGTIFNIQRFSLHDGPGIRTTVFFKGCPLKCIWCHNPESISGKIETVFDSEKCIDCMICKGIRDISTADKCPADSIEKIGNEITVEELFSEIEKDKGYYETSNGGVTFSGGEPLMQSEFIYEILKKCKVNGIHTAIDTCGFANLDNFEKMSELVDLYLYDLKFIDNALHKKYTGTSNEKIFSNLKYLSEKNKRIFIRFPLIPGITDTKKNITEVVVYLKGINFEQINLLSYHGYAKNKYIKLGIKAEIDELETISEERLEGIKQKFISAGFKTVIGG